MLIISKFKDYYDGAVGSSIDKSIVYIRETTEIEQFRIPRQKSWFWMNEDFSTGKYSDKSLPSIDTVWIEFCGTLYFGLRVETQIKHFNYNSNEVNFYYEDDAKVILKTYAHKDILNNLELRRTFLSTQNWCINHNSPVVVWSTYDEKKIINPSLKDYKFYKIADTFQAFQQIQQYISGVLGVSQTPIIETSAKDRLISKGFDYKWSFRKDTPPTRKQK